MANGGLRINQALRKRLSQKEKNKRELKRVKRQLAREDAAHTARKQRLREQGIVLPGDGIVITG